MEKLNEIEVWFNNKEKIGIIKKLNQRPYTTSFRYDKQWLKNGFSISPFSLPLEDKEFIANPFLFDGIFGVFSDSLPDSWGRLLENEILRSAGINPGEIDPINRLYMIGELGMGALTYSPMLEFDIEGNNNIDLDKLSLSCKEIITVDDSEYLDELYKLGGFLGGSKPKILIKVDEEEWIIKFPSLLDKPEIGKQEYDYSICAKKCGVDMPKTRLFSSVISKGHFGVKRFDRDMNNEGIHMITASALLEVSHKFPNLDYIDLLKLTKELTLSEEETKKMFKLMCFNIFAHNRDDHSKNFSFIYNRKDDSWKLSPAYDLIYSNSSIGKEHATLVNGNSKNPGIKEILEVAKKINLNIDFAKETALNIEKIVKKELKEYLVVDKIKIQNRTRSRRKNNINEM